MKVYVINLDRHADRLAHMREQLAAVGFERIAAVDGAREIPEPTGGLTRAELGCLASHRKAWRLFLGGPDEHACFLEDDLHLSPGFDALVGDESWIPADAHAVKLDTYLQKVLLGEGKKGPSGRRLSRLYTRHESSAAYVLSRTGAEKYLELTASASLPADYSLFPKHPQRFGLRVYQLAPAVAIQDHLRTAEDGGLAFPTAMAEREAKARKPPISRLVRESIRLVRQMGDLAQDLYLRTVLNAESTTVDVR